MFASQVSRRMSAGLVAALTACALATGCGSGPAGDNADPDTLTVWFPGNNQAEIDLVTGPIAQKFEEETGKELEITFVDWEDLSTKLSAAFAAGTAPDLFGHGPAAVADYVTNERLEPLDDYVDSMDAADVEDLSGALGGGQVDGTQYLIPLSMQGSLLIYDAADFEAVGLDPDAPPTTWEEVRAAAEKLTVRDGDTITRSGLLLPSQPIGRQQTFASLLASAGGVQIDDEGEVAVDSDAGVEGLEYFDALYSGDDAVSADLGADYINAPPEQQPIVTDQAAIELQSSYGALQILRAAPKLDLRVMDAVPFEGNDSGYVIGGAGPGLMMNADSSKKDLAWQFIEYLVSAETSTEYAEGVGQIPTRTSAADSEYVRSSPVMQAFVRNADAFVPNPNVPGWVEARDTLDALLEASLQGDEDPGDILGRATDEMTEVLERAR